VLFNPSLLDKLYLPLPIIYSDDVVMSRGNRNFHLRLFVKGGALQLACSALLHLDVKMLAALVMAA
jgi:hypothetical protein